MLVAIAAATVLLSHSNVRAGSGTWVVGSSGADVERNEVGTLATGMGTNTIATGAVAVPLDAAAALVNCWCPTLAWLLVDCW
jgi:hypothetical protein